MKTTTSKLNILKAIILFFSITAFILTVLLFTSCSNSDEVNISDDIALVDQTEFDTVKESYKD
ncbi:hypothetical protein [uncultured Polaribacter sp.]|uniref:hypothetical protein n=1 Tax=uncultured Polaribacter sp. TaxID=174711 RepID=UPI00263330CC|nr:hypothetical protein [uncultured Polaribacter sp.]